MPSQKSVDYGHGQPHPGAVRDEAVATELRPHDARVEGVGGDAGAK